MRGYPSIKQINKFSQNQLFQIWIEIKNSKCITQTRVPNVGAVDEKMDVMKSNWSPCSESTCQECILEDTQGLLQLINSRRSGGGQQPAYQDRGSPSRQRTAWQTTRPQSATTQPPLLVSPLLPSVLPSSGSQTAAPPPPSP